MKRSKSTFLSYISSYVILLCIPLVFLLTIRILFINNLKLVTGDLHENKCQQTVYNIEQYFYQVADIDAAFSKAPTDGDGITVEENTKKLQQQLKTIKSANSVIFNIGINMRNDDKIITAEADYSMKEFYNLYAEKKISYDGFLQLFWGIRDRYLSNSFSGNEDSQYVTLFFKYPKYQENALGTLFIMIDKENIDKVIETIFPEGNVVIVGKNNSVIYSLKSDEVVNYEYIFENYWNDFESYKQYTQKIDSKQYIISRYDSQYAEAGFLIYTPSNSIMHSVKRMNMIIFIAFIMLIIVCSLFITFTMKKNYIPLNTIHKKISQADKNKSLTKDLFSSIDSYVDNMNDKLSDLKLQVKNTEDIVLSSLLGKLFKSEIDIQLFMAEISKTAYDFNKYFSVVAVTSDLYGEAPTVRRNFGNIIMECAGQCLSYIYIDSHESTAVLIIESDNFDVVKRGRDIQKFQKYVKDFVSNAICISVSQPCHGLKTIKKCYAEALSALEYSFVLPEDSIILYSDIKLFEENTDIDVSFDIERLKNAIKSKDIASIKSIMSKIISAIKDSKVSMKTIRALCSKIAYVIANDVYDFRYNYGVDTINTDEWLKISNQISDILINAVTIDEFSQLALNIMSDFCSSKESTADDVGEENDVNFLNTCLAYIEENCYSVEFSIANMAEALDTPQSTIGQTFKATIGQTIISYVNDRRIEKAKELLLNSDILVKDLVEKVGFCDVSSFIRKFRVSTGMTPKKFRDKYINKEQ